MKRKICVYTSTRAEYGLLRSVMQEIQAAEPLQLQILASGMHLSPEFGMTIQEIRADGFEPDETVEILLSSDTPAAICKSMGLAMIGYGEAIERLRPEMVVVLGDRFETFCMAGAESYDLLKRYHQGWVEKYLANGNNIRDGKWTKGIAVGSKGFVEHVKSALGALAKGRKAKGSGDSYQLREPSAPYGEHFGVKSEDIGLKNTYFWNFNPE